MFYTIYKITNKINGKIYIGKHQTKDLNDGYMGSGKLIRAAIEKYGLDNFKKEIIFQFDNEADMNVKEAEIVTEAFVKEETNYNLCPGGKGGWGYINSNGVAGRPFRDNENTHKIACQNSIKVREELKKDITWSRKKSLNQSVGLKKKIAKEGKHWSKGKIKHSDEWKCRQSNVMKEKQAGSLNSQYGTMWITNGKENKKIKKEVDTIPEGWYKGRITK